MTFKGLPFTTTYNNNNNNNNNNNDDDEDNNNNNNDDEDNDSNDDNDNNNDDNNNNKFAANLRRFGWPRRPIPQRPDLAAVRRRRRQRWTCSSRFQ